MNKREVERALRALVREMDWAPWGSMFTPSYETVKRARLALGLPVDHPKPRRPS